MGSIKYVYAGTVLGALLPIICCVGLIICCVALCCSKRSSRNQQPVRNITYVTIPPQQQQPSSAYQLSYPGYQPAPVQPAYGGFPNPAAPPPSYLEATVQNPGQPIFTYQPVQTYVRPPPSNDRRQLPYNPAYDPSISAWDD